MQSNGLTLDQYQEQAAKYNKPNPNETLDELRLVLGIVGEAGEIAEKYKKFLRNDNPDDDTLGREVRKEMGDVLWYLAALAKKMDTNLSEIAELNLDKLEKRFQENKIQGNGDNR